jgi:hypothetical protein
MGPGSVLRFGIPPSPRLPACAGSMPSFTMPSVTRVVMRLPSTAPITLTPIVPPRLRKKATEALAVPICRGSTAFCTISTRFCDTMPTPEPSTNM